MNALFEQPLTVLFVGVILVAIAAVAWVQTQHPRALFALVGAIVLLGGGLLLERLVVTPGEEVSAALDQIAAALEANDLAGVEAHLASSADNLRQEVRTYLRLAHVKKVTIKSNLKVTVSGDQLATARFNVVAVLAARQGGGEQPVPRLLVVYLRKEQGAWRVERYEAYDPRGESFGTVAPGA